MSVGRCGGTAAAALRQLLAQRFPGATRAADDAYALAALFNSRWLTALARLSADPARGGFRRFNARVVRGLPLPPSNPAQWRALADQGRANASDDDAIADMYQLEAADRRALDASAADPL